jgi:hypothetical protein
MSTIRAVTQTARRVGQGTTMLMSDFAFGSVMFSCGLVIGWALL